MAVKLPNSVFVHIPKTGGIWVAEALKNSGLSAQDFFPVHATPLEVKEWFFHSPIFTFVRHPLTWYPSMWAQRSEEGWQRVDTKPGVTSWLGPQMLEMETEFSEKTKSTDFQEFIRKAAKHYPEGYLSHLYDIYTDGCSMVGYQEILSEELLRALGMFESGANRKNILNTPMKNQKSTTSWAGNWIYTEELVDIVLSIERKTIEKFYLDQTWR